MKNERSIAASKADNSLDTLFERFYFVKTAEGRARGTLQKYRIITAFSRNIWTCAV